MFKLQKQLADLMAQSKQANTVEGQELYKKLIEEEMNELFAEDAGTAEHFKELLDLLWVTIQLGNQCGYDLAYGMNLLVEEYQSKFMDSQGRYAPIFREDGKLLKGAGFKKVKKEQLEVGMYGLQGA